MDTDAATLLAERQRTHGAFDQVAALSQELRAALSAQPQWRELSVRHREALGMIASKMARIVCGDANFADHWDDIAGYAALAAGREPPR